MNFCVSAPNVYVDDCDAPQLVVEQDEVRLYMDCGEADRSSFQRGPERLTFSHKSGIFVANAGGTGLDKFVVGKETAHPCVNKAEHVELRWFRLVVRNYRTSLDAVRS